MTKRQRDRYKETNRPTERDIQRGKTGVGGG